MWRHVASNALSFFVVALFLLAGVIVWGNKQYGAPGPLADAICLRVESGTNMRAVSRMLEAEGALSSGTIFRLGADYSGKAEALKAGSYLVPAGASMATIIEIVTRGGQSTCGTEVVYRIGVTRAEVQVRELDPASSRFVELAAFDLSALPAAAAVPASADETAVADDPAAAAALAAALATYAETAARPDTRFRVALAEGVTSWQVITSLNAIDNLNGDVAEVPAEGSLAPDSYEFVPGAEVAALLAQMTTAQDRILAEAWAERAEDAPVATVEEALILASIIEKETGVPEERGTVASVFANRLRLGMPLQTDPTVIYGVTEGRGVLGRGLRQSELREPTPWNTYLITGLPPTPIANPGRASIAAALAPEATDFLFFVADGTGGHAFATNLEDHNRNVAAWREIEAQQAAEAAAAAEAAGGN